MARTIIEGDEGNGLTAERRNELCRKEFAKLRAGCLMKHKEGFVSQAVNRIGFDRHVRLECRGAQISSVGA